MNKIENLTSRVTPLKAALLLAAIGLAIGMPAQASTNPDDIVTAAEATFTAVAGVCVTIGVFMIGYRLARKIR